MKLAAVFPGQGSQYVGMGRELADASPMARQAFAKADQILGWSLSQACFEGPKETLDETKVAQPAVFVLSYIHWRLFPKSILGNVAFVAGHSLGEYTAVTAAGVLGFEDGLRLVARRAETMSQAAAKQPGGMAAVLGLAAERVAAYLESIEGLHIANYNCPGQVVISGKRTVLDEATAELKDLGARRIVPLAVSGAFHSPLMAEAEAELAAVLEKQEFNDPQIPLVSNGDVMTTGSQVQNALRRQMTSPVRWQQSVECLAAAGVEEFFEVGPGHVLAGLISRAVDGVRVQSMDNVFRGSMLIRGDQG